MNFSYWEQKQWFGKFDVAIIGSGIVGLNAAIALKKKDSDLRIAILERGFLPAGASTKNAGFACFGSPSELLDDLTRHSEEEVVKMIRDRYLGLRLLKQNVGEKVMDFTVLGSLELFDSSQETLFQNCINKLDYLNNLIASATGLTSSFSIENKTIERNGLTGFQNAIQHQYEGQIDTGKMMQYLLQQAKSMGVEIFNGFHVKSFYEESAYITIQENAGALVLADKMIVATNGFAKQLLPELDVQPARAQVLITKPIDGLKLQGTFHMDQGYYYFRNIDERVLFGGGRNLDFNGETTYELGGNPLIQNELKQVLEERIVPYADVEIDQYWSGIMGVSKQKKAIVKQHTPRTFVAVRMGGMGIAIGSKIGSDVAKMCFEIN